MTRAPWFSTTTLLLVVAGGAVGVAARAALTLPLGADPHPLLLPIVTMAINLFGSLLLGVVVGWLDDRHPRARAFLGTGVLGGFTTYSAFAVQAVTLGSANPLAGLLLMAVSVFGGALAAAAGLRWGRAAAPAGDAPVPEDAE